MSITAGHKKVEEDKKTEELILYICSKLEDEKTFGATVLNKILFYIDASAFVETGKQISRFTYIKQGFGITPNPKEFLPIKDSLIRSERLKEKHVQFFGREQRRPVALAEPDVKLFTSDEIAKIDTIIEALRDANASIVSSISHDVLAYKVANPKEEIPISSYLLTAEYPSEDDIDWARKKIKERKK